MTSRDSSPHYMGNSQLKYEENTPRKMTIPPQDLNIVWGGDDRYWNIRGDGGVAELHQVSWLEVTGCVDGTNPMKEYEVGFEVSLTPDAFGWGVSPLYLMAKRGKDGKFESTKFQANQDETRKFTISGKFAPSEKYWDQSSTEIKKLYFGLYEVWSEKWKGGLKIHCAYVKELV